MHDYENYRFFINGKVYLLTENENELLDLFISYKNKVVTRDMICQRLYLEPYKEYQRAAISCAVSRLNKKFGLHIRTVQGRGYSLKGGIA